MITKALIGALVAVGLFAGVQTFRLANAENKLLSMELAWSTALTASVRRTLKIEREAQEHADEVDAKHQERIEQIEDRYEVLLSNLRDGTERLRGYWLSASDARDAYAAESARLADENARLREESAARIVRDAARCDAIILGWQEFWAGLQQVIQQR